MPNKDRPLVDQHAAKDGVGWLMNAQQGKVCRFENDTPSAHAEWVEVDTRLIRGGGQPVVRRLLRHNAISNHPSFNLLLLFNRLNLISIDCLFSDCDYYLFGLC